MEATRVSPLNSTVRATINITANGMVTGDGYAGIYAINSGTLHDITANGEVTGTNDAGICATNNATAKDITVTTGAASKVTGYYTASAFNAGTGSTMVTANGEVTAYYSGIYATNGANAKDLTVTTGSGSKITGYNSGIKAYNYGTGSTVITANGEVTGTTPTRVRTASTRKTERPPRISL